MSYTPPPDPSDEALIAFLGRYRKQQFDRATPESHIEAQWFQHVIDRIRNDPYDDGR